MSSPQCNAENRHASDYFDAYQLSDPPLEEALSIPEDRTNRLTLNQELAEYQTKSMGLNEPAAKLEIRVPFDRKIVKSHQELHRRR